MVDLLPEDYTAAGKLLPIPTLGRDLLEVLARHREARLPSRADRRRAADEGSCAEIGVQQPKRAGKS